MGGVFLVNYQLIHSIYKTTKKKQLQTCPAVTDGPEVTDGPDAPPVISIPMFTACQPDILICYQVKQCYLGYFKPTFFSSNDMFQGDGGVTGPQGSPGNDGDDVSYHRHNEIAEQYIRYIMWDSFQLQFH